MMDVGLLTTTVVVFFVFFFFFQAMLVHPDKNMGNEKAAEAFKKLQNAYEVMHCFHLIITICFSEDVLNFWV